MPLSSYWKLPQNNLEEDLREIPAGQPIAMPEDVSIPPVEANSEDLKKQQLEEYMKRWEASKQAQAPSVDSLSRRANIRGALDTIASGAGLIANIKGEKDPYNMDKQLAQQDAQDKADFATQQAAYKGTRDLGEQAFQNIPKLQQDIENAPVETALRQEKFNGIQSAQKLAADEADANSQTSKDYQLLAKELGFTSSDGTPLKLSAAQLKGRLPVLSDIYKNRENRAVQAEQANLNRQNKIDLANERTMQYKAQAEDRKAALEMSRNNKISDTANKYYNDNSGQYQKSKTVQNYLKTENQIRQLDDALKNPNNYKSMGAIYALMKGFDPDSVVRESEYNLGANVADLSTRIKNYINNLASGTKLSPTQIKDMQDAIIGMRDAQKQAVQQENHSHQLRAKKLGYDPDYLIDTEASGKSNAGQPTISKSPHGDRVKQNGVDYIWNGTDYVEENK